MSIDARILEVTDETVKLECLISKTKHEFQERVFPKALLEGVVDLEVGSYVLLRILQRPGKIAHVFHNGDGIVQKEVFEDTSRFDDLDDMDLDRMA
ncbi:MAG: hypothetical protein BRD37_03455 [Bacteroidetes bacterium QH_8_67_23]|nr:MAG: hypothetical protein BRD37_03455 [Bacteroidetes bacterium QH_8_67_23]